MIEHQHMASAAEDVKETEWKTNSGAPQAVAVGGAISRGNQPSLRVGIANPLSASVGDQQLCVGQAGDRARFLSKVHGCTHCRFRHLLAHRPPLNLVAVEQGGMSLTPQD